MIFCLSSVLFSLLSSSYVFAETPAPAAASEKMAEGFVDVSKVNPAIHVEMRYFSAWNFVGKPITGYKSNTCLLTKPAAEALSSVQKEMQAQGYSLVVFDCYRPKKAVEEFLNWTKNPGETANKKIFYPEEPKESLVSRGYISNRSGHSRGSTVDLTLIRNNVSTDARAGALKYQEAVEDCRKSANVVFSGQVDMGTSYDCFSQLSNAYSKEVTQEQQSNRRLLRKAMEKHGFAAYSKEWWHFTLKEEPFPNQYFDFDVATNP